MGQIIDGSRQHILDKFGKNGYANEKMYFPNPEYTKFLGDITKLAGNQEAFIKKYGKQQFR